MKKSKKKSLAIRYPWEDWFVLEKFTLKHGKDFHCNPHIMAQQIRNMSSQYTVDNKPIRVSIYVDDKSLTVHIRS